MFINKKDAIRKFKESKSALGVYAVRCRATGRTWVGASRNLEASKNGIWFSLRFGRHHDRDLQEHWNSQGGDAFEYEILEILDDDVEAMLIKDVLKEKRVRWTAQLQASAVL